MSTQPILDATAERMAKGDDYEFVNPATIDSSEQAIGYVRRFKAAHLDRLYRASIKAVADGRKPHLTYRQFAAGDWYRDQHARCSFALSVVASYGERTSASEPAYGLPRTEAQAQARQLYRAARDAFPIHMLGFMDRFLIHDALPRYGQRYCMKSIAEIAKALDRLANWLKLPQGN